jgi:Tol biopolymer transport system component
MSDVRWPAISTQGRIALQNVKDNQVWLIDTDTSTPTQFTFSPGGKLSPIWSPDGQWLAFTTFADSSVHRKRSNGAGDDEILAPGSHGSISDWSPDGKWILQSNAGTQTTDITVLSLEGKRESRPYLANPAYTETRGVFSPNGRWVAYESNESGRFEIYVRPFPDPSLGQSKVSSDGGSLRAGARTARNSTTCRQRDLWWPFQSPSAEVSLAMERLKSFSTHGLLQRRWRTSFPPITFRRMAAF